MSVQIRLASYNDFKTMVDSLPVKGTVYYSEISATGSFWVVFLAGDFNFLVGAGFALPAPSTFATDYPNAIALTDSSISVGNEFSLT